MQAVDRLYLAAELPLLIVWGARDRIIPAEHGRRAHELVPASRFERFESAGHFPHLDEPERFVATLEGWIATTERRRRADGTPLSGRESGEMRAPAAMILAGLAVLIRDGSAAAKHDHVRNQGSDRARGLAGAV